MWEFEEISFEEAESRRGRYGPLTASVRRLIEATIHATSDDALTASAIAEIDAVSAKLGNRLHDRPSGTSVLPDGQGVSWGNMVEGIRNPVAPPLVVELDGEDRAHVAMELGAAYEGPPGHLHGGYCALVLDHVCGSLASRGNPDTTAATGTLTLRYQRPTRLGHLRADAAITGIEGRKVFVSGQLADPDGVTVTAEGIFITLNR